MTDLSAAPPGKRWEWDPSLDGWRLVEDPAATRLARAGGDWFHMPARRREPLDAQHSGVVAAGEAVRRMRS